MKQLSGADSMFLQFERGNNFMHVASLAIYDPSTAPGGGVRFKDVLRLLRLAHRAVPAVPPPAGLGAALARPPVLDRGSDASTSNSTCVTSPLPHPGDWRQLCIQVARLHSRPLDRSKPLWEAYVIEGLHNVPGVPPGSFALYTKMHHAIIDGESGTEIMRALHSLTPEPIDFDAEERSASGVYHADREPTTGRAVLARPRAQRAAAAELARFSLGTARKVACARRRRADQVQQSRRGRLRGQRALAADGRPEHAAAAHAAADPLQRRRLGAPRVRSRLAAARRFQARSASRCRRPPSTTSSSASSAARCTPTCPRKNELPDDVDGRHGADDAARPGKGRRRRQPGRLHADAGALRDRGPARAPARDLRRRARRRSA